MLIRLVTQEVANQESAGIKVQTVVQKEKEIAAEKEKRERQLIQIISEDVKQQVNSLNN
jgi:hypothetical protein